jgi:hypothetical protein
MAKKPTIVAVRVIKTGQVEVYEFPSKKSANSFLSDIDQANQPKEKYQYVVQV